MEWSQTQDHTFCSRAVPGTDGSLERPKPLDGFGERNETERKGEERKGWGRKEGKEGTGRKRAKEGPVHPTAEEV